MVLRIIGKILHWLLKAQRYECQPQNLIYIAATTWKSLIFSSWLLVQLVSTCITFFLDWTLISMEHFHASILYFACFLARNTQICNLRSSQPCETASKQKIPRTLCLLVLWLFLCTTIAPTTPWLQWIPVLWNDHSQEKGYLILQEPSVYIMHWDSLAKVLKNPFITVQFNCW